MAVSREALTSGGKATMPSRSSAARASVTSTRSSRTGALIGLRSRRTWRLMRQEPAVQVHGLADPAVHAEVGRPSRPLLPHRQSLVGVVIQDEECTDERVDLAGGNHEPISSILDR